MSIPANWKQLFTNSRWYASGSNIRIMNNGASDSQTLNILIDGSITVKRFHNNSWGTYESTSLYDKDGVRVLYATQDQASHTVLLTRELSPYSLNHSGNGSSDGTDVTHIDDSLVWQLEENGDLASLPSIQYYEQLMLQTISDVTVINTYDTGIGANVGGVGSVYFPATDFRLGATIAFADADQNMVFDYEVITEKATVLFNGVYAWIFDEQNNSLVTSFEATSCWLKTTAPTIVSDLYYHFNTYGYFVDTMMKYQQDSIHCLTQDWSNRETRAQANPQPEQLVNLEFDSGLVETVVNNNPFYNDVVLNSNGNFRLYGYFTGVTMVGDILVGNKLVRCFEHNTGIFVDSVVSDQAGAYRFDSLLIGRKYIFTAYYGSADRETAPIFDASSADWQSPIPYI